MSDTVTRVMLATRLDPGVQLNDTYEIDERIASGGMGEVYRGHNIQTGEPVAIKTILPELAEQEAISALFKKEATILGRLYHDTIVRYYSFSRDPRLGRPYLAMEFVDGVSLADRIKAKPLDASEVRKLFTGVAEGLALAHSAGVIHRDLSPDNIILRDGDVGRPKLIDFGIARSANFGEGTLIGGGFAGKFNFVSPEQLGIHNREVDSRSDIYSLGLVIAACLRGRPLDMGGSHVDVIEKRSRVPDLGDIDESLRPLVEAMLQPNPDDRPANAAMVAEWLRATKPAEPTAAPTASGIRLPTTPPITTPSLTPWTQANIQPAAPPVPAEPTQVTTGRSQTPFSAPTPPPGGKSPFGSVAAYPAAPANALPGGATAQALLATQRQKSSGGRYAIIGGLLLVLAAAGTAGAYVTGLLGPAKTFVQPPAEGTTQPPATPTEPTTSPSVPTQPTAKSPEHEAIGDALEEAAKAQEAKDSQKVAKAEEPATQPPATQPPATQPPSGEAAVEPVATETTHQPADEAGPAVPDATAVQPEVPATAPDKQTQEAAAGLTKMMDVGVAWLHQYDGGKCFFVAVTGVTNETINIKGFGPNVSTFQTLYDSFMQANGVEPELNGHLINDAQCAAAEFLKAVQPTAKDNPQLTLASDRVKLGDTLQATVDNAEGKVLDLLLVDDEGLVYNVKSFAAQTINNGKMSFEMWVGGLHIDHKSPEMMIALTSKSGLAVPQGKEHVRATALFLKLERQIKDLGGNVGVDFAYFRAKP